MSDTDAPTPAAPASSVGAGTGTDARASAAAPEDLAVQAAAPAAPGTGLATPTSSGHLPAPEEDPAVAPFLREAAALAGQVDGGKATPRPLLARLGEAGLLDLGIQDLLEGRPQAADVRAPARLIASLATECMSTAFGVWAHRMVLDYLARGERSRATEQVLAGLRSGRRPGSTAMASGLKWLSGLEDLAVQAVPDGQGWRLTGYIPWTSNVFEDTVVVLPARTPQGTIVVWVEAGAVELTPVTGLLALGSTASGALRLQDVAVGAEQVISTDLAGLAGGFKPTMLLLQSAFCVGLVRRSLAEAQGALDRAASTANTASTANSVFAEDLAGLQREAGEHAHRWAALAADVDAARLEDVLRVRLQAASLAGRATRLETTLAGGRGYLEASPTSRRFREAAFLPVQSPSEGHLRWELSLLA